MLGKTLKAINTIMCIHIIVISHANFLNINNVMYCMIPYVYLFCKFHGHMCLSPISVPNMHSILVMFQSPGQLQIVVVSTTPLVLLSQTKIPINAIHLSSWHGGQSKVKRVSEGLRRYHIRIWKDRIKKMECNKV